MSGRLVVLASGSGSNLQALMDAIDDGRLDATIEAEGALAIGVCDELHMLQYSTYSVISPEGCASILWKSAEKASDAAQAMGITAERLKELGFVDSLIKEPLGGAHRHPVDTAARVKDALSASLERLQALDSDALLERRYARLMSYGAPAA